MIPCLFCLLVQLRTTIRFFNILGTVARQGIATRSRSAASKEKGNSQQKQRGHGKKKKQPKNSKQPKQAKAKKSAPAKSRPSAAPPFILPATLPPTDALYLLDTYQLESTVRKDFLSLFDMFQHETSTRGRNCRPFAL